VEYALGTVTIDRIADKLGLSGSKIAPALAYLLPKVIRVLAPSGSIPTGMLVSASNVPHAPASVTPVAASIASPRRARPRWLWPLLALLIFAAPAWWLLSKPAGKVTTAPAASTRTASASRPKFGIANVAGRIRYTGVVADESTRDSILSALKHTFGEENVRGKISIDPKTAPAAWLGQLEQALGVLKVPGVEAQLQDDSINIGGLLPGADFDEMKASLQSIFGPDFTVGALAGDTSPWFRTGKDKIPAALDVLKPGFTGADLVAALNLATINFDTGSGAISLESRDLLSKAAALMKTLPEGTVIEIGRQSENTADPAANTPASQQHADAVRLMLINLGVPADRLRAKVRADTRLLASSAMSEGHLERRGVSFSVAR
jgi:OOP family OmpA-OmpF porin